MSNPMTASLRPTHPGELLREDILPALKESTAAIARKLGISRQHLYDIINEKKPITPATALRLGKLFNNSAEFWLRLQMDYDLRVGMKAMAAELDRIPTLQAA